MEPKMAGRNINMQLTPHPERQRVRKFRTTANMVGMAHVPHADDVDHSDPHDDDEDDHHDEGTAAAPAENQPQEPRLEDKAS
jgi:translation initiation factor IF-3